MFCDAIIIVAYDNPMSVEIKYNPNLSSWNFSAIRQVF